MKAILRGLADILFPSQCILCEKILVENQLFSFCPDCFSRIRFIRPPLCPKCGLPYPAEEDLDHLCGDCLSTQQYFSAARSLGVYDNALMEAIQKFKYGHHLYTGEWLGRLLAESSFHSFASTDFDVIMPVPLHIKRLRQRGFNQSLVLARALARRHPIELDFSSLRRKIHTEPQTQLTKSDRATNVRAAFEVTGEAQVKGRKVLLVDDVYTTGSTVRECAKLLLKSGARSVGVLTLARAM